MLSSVDISNLAIQQDNTLQVLVFSKNLVLVEKTNTALPDSQVIFSKQLSAYHGDVLQLHDLDGAKLPIWVVDLGAEQPNIAHCEFVPLRQVMMNAHEGAFDVIGRAWQLIHFYRTHRYCGQCGSNMTRVSWESAMHCNNCGHRCYPRVSPCVIVAVYRDNEILLALNARHVTTGMYSILAGFVESGESLEEAVAREVYEEVGVKISDIEYMGSQPWPFPHALMMGFVAKWQSGELQPDKKEIQDAKWFATSDLPLIPPKFSIAGRLIEHIVDMQQ